VASFDEMVYNRAGEKKEKPHYGNYLLHTLEDDKVEVMVLTNATSTLALPAFTNHMLQHIMRKFSGQDKLKLTFVNSPLPKSIK
jgi:hypothetical protein